MVHERDGDGMAALDLAQVGEDRGDLAGGVLVDPVESDEGIEDEQARLELRHHLVEARPVSVQIEAQGRRSDHLDVEVGEVHAGGAQIPSSRRRTT